MSAPDDARLLHARLAHHAADSIAIVSGESKITFGQLTDDVFRFAGGLIRRGFAPGDRVALVCEKSPASITAILGTLAAGGIAAPLQTQWPVDRVDTVIADCEPRFVVRDTGSGKPAITETLRAEAASWDEMLAAPAGAPVAIDAESIALLLFTSGSTGKPKGVMLSHRAVAAFVNWAAAEFRIGMGDRICCPASLSFDLSTLDMFGCALHGATCIIAQPAFMWLPRFLVQLIEETSVTVHYSVPSLLSAMAGKGGLRAGRTPGLRVALFAGEPWSGSEAVRLQKAIPQAELCNLYGPTETNVATFYRVPLDFDSTAPLPIGVPCPYADVRIDSPDDAGRGELLIAGESVMSGYWRRPEESARCLIPRNGKTFYRTGDTVSAARTGEFLFHGRADRQVKRRGFRLELGDIEQNLLRNPVIAAVGVVCGASSGIEAYVELRAGSDASTLQLREHAAGLLPPYAIPDRFVIVNNMPRNDRGKVDHFALLAHDRTGNPA